MAGSIEVRIAGRGSAQDGVGFGLLPLIAAIILWTLCGPLRPIQLDAPK